MAFPTGWSYRLAITIDKDSIDSNLTNWTLVFDQSFASVLTQVNGPLDADGTKASLNGGGDVRFSSDSAGNTRLACDVRTWVTANDPSTATCEVAVKVPSVSSSTDTTIYLWWGKSGETQPAKTDTYGQYNAYDSDYVLVLPLNESPSSATDNYKDRTSGQHHGTETSSPGLTQVSGKIGKGIHSSDNGNDGYIAVSSFSDVQSMSALSVECCVQRTATGDPYSEIIRKGTAGSWFLLKNTTTYYRFSKVGDSSEYSGSGQSATQDTWFHICGTGTSSTTKLYANGVSKQTTSISGIGTNTDAIAITNYQGAGQQWVGDIDEVRISKVARSAAWAKANYNNQFNTSGFLTWGSITDVGGTTHSLAGNIAAVASAVGTLAVTAALAGSIAAASTLTGNLSHTRALAGHIAAQSALTGDLVIQSQTQALEGAIAATSTVTGDLSHTRALVGAISAQSALTGNLSHTRALAGAIAATSTLSGNLVISSQTLSLAGSIAAQSSLTGDLTQIQAVWSLAGDIAAQSVLTGDLSIVGGPKTLAGHVQATSSLNGTLSQTHVIAGSIAAQSSLTGDLTLIEAVWSLAGHIAAQSALTGDLTLIKGVWSLAGSIAAQSTLTGYLIQQHTLFGSIAATAIVYGNLVPSGAVGEIVSLTSTLTTTKSLTSTLTTTKSLTSKIDLEES